MEIISLPPEIETDVLSGDIAEFVRGSPTGCIRMMKVGKAKSRNL